MGIEEERDRRLDEAPRRELGEEEGATLMNRLGQAATRADLVALETRLDARIDGLRAEVRIGFAELRGELRAELAHALREQTTRVLAVTISALLGGITLSSAVVFALSRATA
jgi:hypothetical protein